MNALLVLPILIPLIAAAASLVAWRSRRVQRTLGLLGMALLFVVAVTLLVSVWNQGIQSVQLGNWPAPFGITLVADLFSAIMVVVASVTGLAVAVYSTASIDARREAFGYFPLIHLLLMGVCGAFITGDIFNLFVWFEVLLIGSFVLLTLGGERAQLEGALKYVTLNLISSALFLAAVGMLYGTAGTLNMADLALVLPTLEEPGLVTTLAMLFLIAFGLKAAFFPLFFWLPASYHTPPVAITAIFAGLLTKVGLYALIRTFTLLFIQDVAYTHTIILGAAAITMIVGALGAIAQNELRRVLSFLIISHIGTAVIGLGILTPLALTGSIFYIIEDIIVLTNLFLMAGVIRQLGGSEDIRLLGGLYRAFPLMALLFLISAFSLVGIPPFAGFFAKLTLVSGGLAAENYLIIAVTLISSVLNLYVVTRLWLEIFWKAAPEAAMAGLAQSLWLSKRQFMVMLLPIVALASLSVLMGLGAQAVLALSSVAAEQLLNPALYIQAVLGG